MRDTRARVAQVVRWACELDVAALKPGNVGDHAAGHGMHATQFRASALAAAVALARPAPGVGARVLAAVRATRRVAGCNTNLGICLLLAPLVQSALHGTRAGLREDLEAVLAALDRDDAAAAYAAIRLAAPGGLGEVAEHDVTRPPDVTLLEAMRAAAGRDRIAAEYASGYAGLWQEALPHLGRCLREGLTWAEATSRLFVHLAARWPDSHVARRHGSAAAAAVQERFAAVERGLRACHNPLEVERRLLALDGELKRAGINPGTTADLVVATLVMSRLGGPTATHCALAGRRWRPYRASG